MNVIVRINKKTFSMVRVYGPTQVRALADENEDHIYRRASIHKRETT